MIFVQWSSAAIASIDSPLANLISSSELEEPKKEPKQVKITKPQKTKPILEEESEEDDALEFTPFIERGNIPLPIAPGVMETMADQEVPDSILEEVAEEKVEKSLAREEEEDNEENELADVLAGFFEAEETIKAEAPKEADIPPITEDRFIKEPDESLAINTISEEIEKPDLSIKQKEEPIIAAKPNDVKTKVIAKTAPIPSVNKKTPQEIVAPPLPNLAVAQQPSEEPKKAINLPKPKKATKTTKPQKLDRKLMRFVRDESVFILFKDDDIVLGKLTERAKIDQMPFNNYLNLYYKNQEKKAGKKRAKRIEKFIEARSGLEPVPLPDRYLREAMQKEIKLSNLTNLKVLEDNYEIIDMVDDDGNTALHLATYDNNSAIVKWLIMRGTHLEPINFQATTPKEIAGANRNWQIFDMLEKAEVK